MKASALDRPLSLSLAQSFFVRQTRFGMIVPEGTTDLQIRFWGSLGAVAPASTAAGGGCCAAASHGQPSASMIATFFIARISSPKPPVKREHRVAISFSSGTLVNAGPSVRASGRMPGA